MRTIFIAVSFAATIITAGCSSEPRQRPNETVRGTDIHTEAERREIWEKMYVEREKEAREKMERPPEFQQDE